MARITVDFDKLSLEKIHLEVHQQFDSSIPGPLIYYFNGEEISKEDFRALNAIINGSK